MTFTEEQKKDIIQTATEKFGMVVQFKSNILLIKRAVQLLTPDNCFMTVLVEVNERGIFFHWGHYDMTLSQSVHDFQDRLVGCVNQLHENAAAFAKLLTQIRQHSLLSDENIAILSEEIDADADDILSTIQLAASLTA